MSHAMKNGTRATVVAMTAAMVLALGASAERKKWEDFDRDGFARPIVIENEWLPLWPGTRMISEGTSVDDEGEEESRRIITTVTDLTKVIDGVRAVVIREEDWVDGELAEAKIAFFAQDNDGNVWHLGQYSEEYDEGVIEATPTWIHGLKGSKAGIAMPADPKPGTPSFSQGWAPSVSWTDRSQVHEMGQKTTVPAGSYEDVLVMAESSEEEPGAKQLKYHARGVGVVRVGFLGDQPDQETMTLVKIEQLGDDEMAKVRNAALALDESARENSRDMYALTQRLYRGSHLAQREEPAPGKLSPDPSALGSEEFGLTRRQLVQASEKVEGLIAQCMREQGFEYVAADFKTVRRGMTADKRLPGLDEEEFTQKYGFGVSTLYTGQPPQLADGYSPTRVGLGQRNVEIYRSLSPADQVAYNRSLFGENADASFAVSLETENFSRTGGCTRQAIEEVFEPEQLSATYYNPKDFVINQDPRMKAALREYAEEMRKQGFAYNHPDEVETDIRERLAALTGGRSVPVENMSPDQKAALEELQDYERRAAVASFTLQEELFDPVEEKIEKEMFAREVK
jgi:hypothetical protein